MLPGALAAQGLAVVSGASYGEQVSPGSLASVFGSNLAPAPAVGTLDARGRLPIVLGGVTVEIAGRAAGLAYVSGSQVNMVIPEETPAGQAAVSVSYNGVVVAMGTAEVAPVAPGLFAADGSGAGPGAILNAVTWAGGPFLVETAETAGCDKRTRLAVFGTGFRDAASVEVSVEDAGGAPRTVDAVEFAGATESSPGLDQLNLRLPADFDNAGELTLRVTADGVTSNAVTFTVGALAETSTNCVADGVALVYNSVADLLAGDLWDVTTPAKVFADLASVPGSWPLMGVGTTAMVARNGELISYGYADSPELIWADPEFPPTVRTLVDEPIPFVGVAAGNPASAVVAMAEPGRSIHEQIVELARANHMAFAGIRVSGVFSKVSYSVAHNLLKEGTPLTDPAADKAPYQLFFDVEGDTTWEMSGFYAAAANTQSLVSVIGAPVHLHGFESDRARAGHIGAGIVTQAEIRLYPLAAPTVMDSDLVIESATLAAPQTVGFQVANIGDNTVTRTTVQGVVGDTVVFQFLLAPLASQESQEFTVMLPPDVDAAAVRVVVDPFNEVLESNENNNSLTVTAPE